MKTLFLLLPVVYLAGNGYLYYRLLQTMSCLPVWSKILLSVVYWIVAFSLFISMGLRDTDLPHGLLRVLFAVGSVWLVFLLYAVMLLIVADIVKHFFPAMGNPLWYVLPLTTAILLYGYVNYKHPKIEQIKISTSYDLGGKTLRAVVVSDVHLGYGTGVASLKKYVQMINAQKPDVVLIVGDLIDNSITPLLNQPFDQILSEIQTPQGIYMVPGNHEYISDIDRVKDYLDRTPITLLQDSIVTLHEGIQIVGRDDLHNKHRLPLEQLLARTDRERPTIVLDHQPYHLYKADSLGVDVMLCGHTHRGQIFPLNLLVDQLYEQSHGYRKWSHSHIWVSSGLSLWGPTFRIGTNSELAVIEISGV